MGTHWGQSVCQRPHGWNLHCEHWPSFPIHCLLAFHTVSVFSSFTCNSTIQEPLRSFASFFFNCLWKSICVVQHKLTLSICLTPAVRHLPKGLCMTIAGQNSWIFMLKFFFWGMGEAPKIWANVLYDCNQRAELLISVCYNTYTQQKQPWK